jgi:endogenous inhibitor of DNA gyrase (YacG/DUF329 family)
MKPVACPTCKQQVAPPSAPTFPFCCDRCRLIDLGNWLGGKYRVPGPPVNIDETDIERENNKKD